ncbi:glycosyltransferase [Rothia nasimurium]|uniref:glycosyltransferase n=1 Tax=Rothia nasimurium TaxID=85336 RepID=UPI003BA0731A
MVSDQTTQQTPPERIVAVVVTFNRRELLEQTLAGIAGAAMTPDMVVIVDNASTDGTDSYLQGVDYPLPTDVIHLSQNMGGAGGFTVGIDRALARHGADLVWVMDDDTEPTEATLSEAYAAWSGYSPVRAERPAVVASKVVWSDGRDHPMNTMRTMFRAGASRTQRAEAVGARPIRSASFVSILMDAAALRATDLPLADFFIWNDDFEYTTRLIHHSNGIAVHRSVARHHTKTFGTTDTKPGPRFYNDVRNKLWVFCSRRTLSPLEKILYGGSTLRLWASTLIRTDEKKTYVGYFLKGLMDAAQGYAPNEEVLRDVYELEFTQRAARLRANYSTDASFSLLMSVYQKDSPEFLDVALRSNTLDQTLPPSEVVIVQDGPLPQSLVDVIDRFAAEASQPVKIKRLEENHGLAAALTEGLELCSYDIVARADADDISLPHRFELQIPRLASGELDVLGGAMIEFSSSPDQPEAIRESPLTHDKIRRDIVRRNPMHHPTVVFRKTAVEAVGSYVEVPGAEDYWLWARMVKAGFVLGNLPETLVAYRVSSAYNRRGGLKAFCKDVQVQTRLYTGEVLNPGQLGLNLLVRGVYRFTPVKVRTKAFRKLYGRYIQTTPTGRDGND